MPNHELALPARWPELEAELGFAVLTWIVLVVLVALVVLVVGASGEETVVQRLGGRLAFDQARRVFMDNPAATALLDGPAPRAGWEGYYRS